MRKYYYMAAVCHSREIPVIIKDSSVLWLIRRAAAMMNSSLGNNVRLDLELPKGATKDRWCYVGCAKVFSKIKQISDSKEPDRIDFYITRSKQEKLAPLTTKKGHFIGDPVADADFLIGEYDAVPTDFITEMKLYKCEVSLVLVQSGSNI